MGTIIVIATAILAFACGVIWTKLRYHKKVEKNGCPFKQACLTYNEIETKEAVKRVLTLLVDNEVPKKEIKQIVQSTLK